MYLDNMDIQEQLENELATFLAKPMSFDVLKDYLVKQKPLKEIQERMETILLEAADVELQKEPTDPNENQAQKVEDIEEECNSLLEQAEELNYSLFVEQLNALTTLPFKNTNEVKAFRNVLKLMNDALNQKKLSATIEENLKEAKRLQRQLPAQYIAVLKGDVYVLCKLNSLYDFFTIKMFNLNQTSLYLSDVKSELSSELRAMSGFRGELVFPGVLLFMSVVLIIPVIPILLLAIPEAPLVALAAVAAIITAFIIIAAYLRECWTKYKMNENLKQIEDNNLSLEQCAVSLRQCEIETADDLSKKMSTLALTIEQLNSSFIESKQREESLISEANDIKPKLSAFSRSSIFSQPSTPKQDHQRSANDEGIQNDGVSSAH